MSLRFRFLVSIALVLTFTLLLGSGLIYLDALNKVDTEMKAALVVGARTVQNATDDAEEAADPRRQLELVVEDFNGNRHVQAFLMNNNGVAVDKSNLLVPSDPAPDWFNLLLARESKVMQIFPPSPFARYGSIILTTDSHNEIDEVWSDFVVTLVILAVFCTLVLSLVYLILGKPLRLLRMMSSAFGCVGSGDYSPRIKEAGPREMKDLARCFNEMVGRLAEMECKNYRLETQLATVQEEERLDLARDLHDEIGPLLFALRIDISTLQSQDWERSAAKIADRLSTMSSAVATVQQHVRSMVGKLRPAVLLDLGLSHAIDNLVAFWSKRQDKIRITAFLERETFGEKLDVAIYRIFQEALTNALRHGHPSVIDLRVASDEHSFVLVEVRDNGSGFVTAGRGFGITGMDERVQTLGGTLEVSNCAEGGGWIRARLPLENKENARLREVI